MKTLPTIALVSLLGALLGACSETPAPAPATPEARAGAAPTPAAPQASTVKGDSDELLARANAALAAEQLFEPVGENALELYLAAIDAAAREQGDDSGQRTRRLADAMAQSDRQEQIQLAITDIFPYGLIWVERAVAEDRRDDAERVLALLRRAQPQSAALDRLRELIDQPPAEIAVATPAPTPATPTPPAAEPAAAPPVPSTAATAATVGDDSPAASTPPIATPTRSTPDLATSTPPPTPASTASAPAPAAASTPPPAAAPPRTQAATPVVLSQAAPRYPPRALKQRLEGWVLVSFTIQANGSVDDVQVLDAEPSGIFDREAIGSMRRWKFQPPGQPITAQRRIEFKLGS